MKPESTKTDEKSWALPGEPISIEEFEMGIKEAEKGSFMTLEELKRSVDKWKREQNL
jgi:predicted transcriptional regulator